jgi:hypothetical protein
MRRRYRTGLLAVTAIALGIVVTTIALLFAGRSGQSGQANPPISIGDLEGTEWITEYASGLDLRYSFGANGQFVWQLDELVRTGRYALGADGRVTVDYDEPFDDGRTRHSFRVALAGDNLTVRYNNGFQRDFRRFVR